MDDLREVVRRLVGPLEVEARRGYPDAAGIGQSVGGDGRAGWGTPALQEGHQPAGAWLEEPWAEGRWKSAAWAKRLGSLGVETRRDLLDSFPRGYAPRKGIG